MKKIITEKRRHFYLWRHPYTQNTCYGVTDRPERRLDDYMGHNGFDIEWSFLAEGPADHVTKLEKTFKQKLTQLELSLNQKIIFQNREWILNNVEYQTIEAVIDKLIEDYGWGIKIMNRSA
jgi:hypothetical protein